MTLLAIYLGCLVLGGILVGASMMGGGDDGHGDADGGHDALDQAGGHELDHGADVGHVDDVGHDHAHDHAVAVQTADVLRPGADAASLLSTFISLRFWTFLLASFGLAGTLLTLVGAPVLVSLPLSLGTGFLVGTGVTSMMRRLAQDTVTTETSTRQLAGREAEIMLSVGPGKRGKIRVVHNGQTIELFASTREDRLLERGERVLVVEIRDGEADVTPVAPGRHPPGQVIQS